MIIYTITLITLGILSILTGILMMRKNRKVKLAFFIELIGLMLIIGAVFEPSMAFSQGLLKYISILN